MSSGETPIEPSPSDGTYAPSFDFSDETTPRRCAIAATFSGPRSSVSRANTVLSEASSALVMEVDPRYECEYVETSHGSK